MLIIDTIALWTFRLMGLGAMFFVTLKLFEFAMMRFKFYPLWVLFALERMRHPEVRRITSKELSELETTWRNAEREECAAHVEHLADMSAGEAALQNLQRYAAQPVSPSKKTPPSEEALREVAKSLREGQWLRGFDKAKPS